MSAIPPPSGYPLTSTAALDDASAMRQRRMGKVVFFILAIATVAYGTAWLPIMGSIASSMRQPIENYSAPPGAEQQFTLIMLASFVPLIILIAFAIKQGRMAFRVQPGHAASTRGEYWAIALSLLSLLLESQILRLLGILAVVLSPITQLWQFLVSLLPIPIPMVGGVIVVVAYLGIASTLLAVLIGGISLQQAAGTLLQRLPQYLMRVAFILSIGVLLGVFTIFAFLLLFAFHPLHLVW
jgi:hypothetical protein